MSDAARRQAPAPTVQRAPPSSMLPERRRAQKPSAARQRLRQCDLERLHGVLVAEAEVRVRQVRPSNGQREPIRADNGNPIGLTNELPGRSCMRMITAVHGGTLLPCSVDDRRDDLESKLFRVRNGARGRLGREQTEELRRKEPHQRASRRTPPRHVDSARAAFLERQGRPAPTSAPPGSRGQARVRPAPPGPCRRASVLCSKRWRVGAPATARP